MPGILALDIGRKHTGVSYADTSVRIALPLDTIHHDDVASLLTELKSLIDYRNVTCLLIGLPVLLSGQESEQTSYVRGVTEEISSAFPYCGIEYIDERETSKGVMGSHEGDLHARAATTMLSVWLERRHV